MYRPHRSYFGSGCVRNDVWSMRYSFVLVFFQRVTIRVVLWIVIFQWRSTMINSFLLNKNWFEFPRGKGSSDLIWSYRMLICLFRHQCGITNQYVIQWHWQSNEYLFSRRFHFLTTRQREGNRCDIGDAYHTDDELISLKRDSIAGPTS